MAAITLYDLDVTGGRRPSPFCWRAKFALAHKRLSWDEIAVGFTEKDKIAFCDARARCRCWSTTARAARW